MKMIIIFDLNERKNSLSLIVCDRVSLSYDGKNVITDLSFTVNEGEYLCIVGENGSGKSTLIKALLGLKSLSSGQITYGDGLHGTEIGYLPQKYEMQKDFPASVREVILSGRLNSRGLLPFYTKSDRESVETNAARLGITELLNRSFSELSGGQQQRVLLARALCATKKLILLDEPVAGLDPDAGATMYSLIERLNSEGITVIMVSHDLIPALGAADRVLRLGGNAYGIFTPQEYLNSISQSGGKDI